MPLLSVGRIGRAHGVRGELAVKVDSPSESVLLEVERVRLSGEPTDRRVLSARAAHAEVLLRLEGVADRTAAEALRGRDVQVDRAELPAPEEGEFYFADLVGLEAVDEQGKSLGRLNGVWETGAAPVLVIGEGASELLVPFAEAFVVRVELEQKRVVLRPPEYTE
jgi:16S rRNA processing protein RimM